jgi:hypothetical protein
MNFNLPIDFMARLIKNIGSGSGRESTNPVIITPRIKLSVKYFSYI